MAKFFSVIVGVGGAFCRLLLLPSFLAFVEKKYFRLTFLSVAVKIFLLDE
jgi:hypothetical protein